MLDEQGGGTRDREIAVGASVALYEISRRPGKGRSSASTRKDRLHLCLASYEFPPKTSGGIGTCSYYLAKTMGAAGHRVSVITLEQEHLPDLPNVYYYTVPIQAVMPRVGHDLAAIERNANWTFELNRKLAECHRSQPIDVIETTDYYGERLFLESPVIIGQNRTVPLVTHFHNSASLVAELNGKECRATARGIDILTQALSCHRKSYTPQKAAYISSKVPGPECSTVIAPFVPPRFKPNCADEFSCDFLFFGRLSEVKGVFLFADALEELTARGHTPRVRFVGSDVEQTDNNTTSRAMIQEQLGPLLGDRLVFTGHLPYEQALLELSGARVIVVPSRWESLGYAALEALSSGRPVVCGKGVHGVYFLAEEFLSRVIVDAEMTTSFADRLEELFLNDDECLDALGASLSGLTVKHFDQKKIVEDHVNYYRSVIASEPVTADPALEGLIRELVQGLFVDYRDIYTKYSCVKAFSDKQRAHVQELLRQLQLCRQRIEQLRQSESSAPKT